MLNLDSEHSLRFSIEIQGISDIAVTQFEFSEGLSELFNGKLMLSSTDYGIEPEKIIDNQAILTLYRNGQLVRQFNGIIKSFTKGDTGHHYTVYHAEIVPTLYRLSLVTDSRIFQHKSVVDIVEELLAEHGISQYALALRNSHEMREYCVQYRESALAFIERILAEEGIFYYFEHGDNGDLLILADSSTVAQVLEGEYEYNPNPGGFVNRASINHFSLRSELAPTTTVLKDYSF